MSSPRRRPVAMRVLGFLVALRGIISAHKFDADADKYLSFRSGIDSDGRILTDAVLDAAADTGVKADGSADANAAADTAVEASTATTGKAEATHSQSFQNKFAVQGQAAAMFPGLTDEEANPDIVRTANDQVTVSTLNKTTPAAAPKPETGTMGVNEQAKPPRASNNWNTTYDTSGDDMYVQSDDYTTSSITAPSNVTEKSQPVYNAEGEPVYNAEQQQPNSAQVRPGKPAKPEQQQPAAAKPEQQPAKLPADGGEPEVVSAEVVVEGQTALNTKDTRGSEVHVHPAGAWTRPEIRGNYTEKMQYECTTKLFQEYCPAGNYTCFIVDKLTGNPLSSDGKKLRDPWIEVSPNKVAMINKETADYIGGCDVFSKFVKCEGGYQKYQSISVPFADYRNSSHYQLTGGKNSIMRCNWVEINYVINHKHEFVFHSNVWFIILPVVVIIVCGLICVCAYFLFPRETKTQARRPVGSPSGTVV